MLPLKLYAAAVPSGFRVATVLEFLGLEYTIQTIDTKAKEQKEPWYLAINPNGRVPILVDPNTGLTITQTAAIALYLVEKYDADNKFSYKYGTDDYYKQLEYLAFSVSEFAPINGELLFFTHKTEHKDEFARDHTAKEILRIIDVFEQFLTKNKQNGLFFVGDHYSIVDASVYGWSRLLSFNGIDISQFVLFKKWYQKFNENEIVQRGVTRLLNN